MFMWLHDYREASLVFALETSNRFSIRRFYKSIKNTKTRNSVCQWIIHINISFLGKNMKCNETLSSIRVVNGVANNAIKLTKELNSKITKNVEEKEYWNGTISNFIRITTRYIQFCGARIKKTDCIFNENMNLIFLEL